jgi:LysM repeat protein
MNTPSPLQPLGRLSQPGSGKPGFNLAVITIVALHVVFFGGLLLQGCRPQARDDQPPLLAPATNVTNFPESLAGLGQPYPDATTNLAALAANTPDALSFTSSPPAAPSVPTNLWTAPPADTSQPDRWALPDQPAAVEPPPVAPRLTEYKVVKGDNPSRIAQKHGITLAQLREANPDMRDRDLQPNHTLLIPPAAPKATSPLADAGAAAPAGKTYRVKPGDNLTKIAQAHGTTVKALRSLNQLKSDRIVANQTLQIPASSPTAAPTPPR